MGMIRRSIVAFATILLFFAALPYRADAQVSVTISVYTGPPDIPAYYQPQATQPNVIWQPGYWAWGPAGYYWILGTWVEAPQPGLLWTPGYWASSYDAYVWHPGYWAQNVGYYGGIDYGCGYYGSGYSGGRWNQNRFEYNTAVSNVNRRFERNVYSDRSFYVNRNADRRVSYNGGPNGIVARPSAQQISVERMRHFRMTGAQSAHAQAAQQNRSYLATVNHGKPNQVSVPRPLARNARPVGFAAMRASDRTQAQAQQHAAQMRHVAQPQHLAQPQRAAQPMHVAQSRHATQPQHAKTNHAPPPKHAQKAAPKGKGHG